MRYVWALVAAVAAVACCFAPAIAEMASPNRAVAILHQELSTAVDAFGSEGASATASGTPVSASRNDFVAIAAAAIPCHPTPNRRGGSQPARPSGTAHRRSGVPERVDAADRAPVK